MLAEIFFLRLEAMLRASEVADRAKNSRFVPLSDDVLPGFRESETKIQEDVISLMPSAGHAISLVPGQARDLASPMSGRQLVSLQEAKTTSTQL